MTICLEFENKTSIPNAEIEKIVQRANLPSCKLLLVVGDEGTEENTHFGEFVPKMYLDDVVDCPLIVGQLRDKEWDIGIVIYKKVSDLFDEYPALFAFVLGHELGHAKAYLEKPENYPLYCLIGKGLIQVGCKSEANLPHEIMFDEFGKYISEAGDNEGASILKNAIDNYIKKNPNDDFRFGTILVLNPSSHISDCSDKLLDLANPYADKLIDIWESEGKKGETALLSERHRLAKLLKMNS